jgi:cyclase
MLDAGATRVVLGTGAVEEPALVSRAAARFGASTLVGAIRARTGWVYTHGGTRRTRKEALPWARQLADRGAGEILFLPLDDEGPDRLAELASSLPIGVLYAGPVGGDPVAASRAGAVGVLVGEAEVAAARHALRREATAR